MPSELYAFVGVQTCRGVQLLRLRRGRVRSEARYLRSNDAAATKVIGTIQSLAVVASTSRTSCSSRALCLLSHAVLPDSFIAEHSVSTGVGQLQSFLWDDVTCGSCGGRGGKYCLEATSYDATQYTCTSALQLRRLHVQRLGSAGLQYVHRAHHANVICLPCSGSTELLGVVGQPGRPLHTVLVHGLRRQ